MWDQIIYQYQNFDDATFGVWTWISNFIPHCSGREIVLQMVVVSIFRWLSNLRWKEKMKIYRYEADTAFSKTLAAAYQHRRLPP